jgi:succinyl-CoA synthetase beta subunit
VILASPEGGVEIEEVAKQSPERLMTVPMRFDGLVKPYHLMRVAHHMGWKGDLAKQGMAILSAVAKLFVQTDALLLEINPLVKTAQGQLVALDAKLSVDENALFRQKRLAAMDDVTQIPRQEAEAKKYELAYIALDGNIGCMVNGAGLAMATMDIIQHYKGKPANFLDVGGGATQEKVAEGFKLILSDPQVRAIFVNIFGGIMNCVTLAGGIIVAAGQLGIKVPLIVRMEGNNVENGRRMLVDSGLNLIVADGLADAAQKAVAAAKRAEK